MRLSEASRNLDRPLFASGAAIALCATGIYTLVYYAPHASKLDGQFKAIGGVAFLVGALETIAGVAAVMFSQQCLTRVHGNTLSKKIITLIGGVGGFYVAGGMTTVLSQASQIRHLPLITQFVIDVGVLVCSSLFLGGVCTMILGQMEYAR